MEFLPIFADLKGRPCLVVGGGEVAARKVHMLHRAADRITVVAPELCDELKALAEQGELRWVAEPFAPAHLEDSALVIAATNRLNVNQAVAEAARARDLLINVVDQPELCNYVSPAIVDRSPLVVAISTGGAMPVLARRVRSWLENLLPANIGQLALAARRARKKVARKIPDLLPRRHLWERIVTQGLRGVANPRQVINDALAHGPEDNGRIFLVGAGPGDPDLLTLKAAQVLQQADVIVYDSLVGPGILDRARRDAEFIDVGKRAGSHSASQEHINQLLVDKASEGRVVCRLKGGDPAFFARAGEELLAARAAGIPVELVPGVTAASGCAAAAGIPLTHRNLAHSVVLATAHCQQQLECLDTRGLASDEQTLVFYMPVRQLAALKDKLLAAGLASDTACAIVENGTRPEQRVLTCTLDELERTANNQNVATPALLMMGPVLQLLPNTTFAEGGAETIQASLASEARQRSAA